MAKNQAIKSKDKFNSYTYVSAIVASLLILVLILSKTIGFTYVSNDDVFLQAILSGKITGSPDAHAIYILYPLAWIISILYRIFPALNWYGLFIVGMHLICWGIILEKMGSTASTKWKQIRNLFLTYFFLIFLDLQWLVFSQYTALASIIMCAAFICIIRVKNQEKLSEYVLPMILIVISFMLRSSASLMCLCFILILMFIKLIYSYFDLKDRKKTIDLLKVYIKIIAIIGIAFAGILLIHNLAYQSDEWKYYGEYNDYRTEVYDYYLYPAYVGNEEFYDSLGIQEEEMYIIQSANLDLDTDISSETMQKIYEKSKEIKEEYLQYSNIPRRIIFDYLDSFDEANRELIIAYLLYGATLVLVVRSKENAYIIGVVMTFLARSGMRAYLIFMERLPDRVSSPLTLIEIVSLLGILFLISENEKNSIEEEKNNRVFYAIGSVIILLFMVLLLADVYKENLDRSIEIQNEDAWSENILPYISENPEGTYFLDVYSVASMKAPIFGGTKFPENAIILGGWIQESPLLEQQYINRFAVESNEMLLLAEDTYFVQRADLSTEWLVDYFESIGYQIEVEVVNYFGRGAEDIFNVYRLYQLN